MTYEPGDVVLTDLGIGTGHEQAGTRPAVFLSEEGGVSIVIPFSTNSARLKYRGAVSVEPNLPNGLAKISVALVFQLRAVDSRRLLHRIGTLSPKDRRALNKVIRTSVLLP